MEKLLRVIEIIFLRADLSIYICFYRNCAGLKKIYMQHNGRIYQDAITRSNIFHVSDPID